MIAEYMRKINKSSLMITPEEDCLTDKESIGMFHYNEIPYFLKMDIQRQDTGLRFQYDITGKRSLEQLLEYKQLDYELLQMILKSFDQACMQAEDFMLDENDILLQPDLIFADHNIERMSYCYLPGHEKDICTQFQKLMEYLLQLLDHKDETALQLAYGVYQKVVQERVSLHHVLEDEKQMCEIYQLTENRNMLNQSQISGMQTIKGNLVSDHLIKQDEDHVSKLTSSNKEDNTEKNKDMQIHDNQIQDNQIQDNQIFQKPISEHSFTQNMDSSFKIKQKESLRQQAAEKLKRMLKKRIYTNRDRDEEENTIFEADEEEMVCSHPTVCLVPETNEIQNQFVYQGADRSRDFCCMKSKMLLGSDTKESDICIPFPMVSRVHARVEIETKGTFLEDLNSTNGTHVNGELLQYHEKRMLQKGDIISLAGECYSFH